MMNRALFLHMTRYDLELHPKTLQDRLLGDDPDGHLGRYAQSIKNRRWA